MRRVTCRAPLGFQGSMFVGKRSLFVGMTLQTTCIRADSKSRLLEFKASVGIMTVAAFHHSFENFVMEWLIKVGLHFRVTANA